MKKNSSAPILEYSNPFMQVRHTKVEFDSFHKNYYVVELGPRAGIVVSRSGRILLTRQYRFLLDADSWEIPGGRVDQGETAEIAAVRECLEETGVRCRRIEPLVVYYPGLDNFDNRTTLFYCHDADVSNSFAPNPMEITELAWVDLAECLERIYRGEIMDALTVTGILAYQARTSGSNFRG